MILLRTDFLNNIILKKLPKLYYENSFQIVFKKKSSIFQKQKIDQNIKKCKKEWFSVQLYYKIYTKWV